MMGKVILVLCFLWLICLPHHYCFLYVFGLSPLFCRIGLVLGFSINLCSTKCLGMSVMSVASHANTSTLSFKNCVSSSFNLVDKPAPIHTPWSTYLLFIITSSISLCYFFPPDVVIYASYSTTIVMGTTKAPLWIVPYPFGVLNQNAPLIVDAMDSNFFISLLLNIILYSDADSTIVNCITCMFLAYFNLSVKVSRTDNVPFGHTECPVKIVNSLVGCFIFSALLLVILSSSGHTWLRLSCRCHNISDGCLYRICTHI